MSTAFLLCLLVLFLRHQETMGEEDPVEISREKERRLAKASAPERALVEKELELVQGARCADRLHVAEQYELVRTADTVLENMRNDRMPMQKAFGVYRRELLFLARAGIQLHAQHPNTAFARDMKSLLPLSYLLRLRTALVTHFE